MGPPLWLQAKAPEDAWFITDLCFILASLPCSEPCTWCFLGKKLCIKISALGTQFGVLCTWWTLPELGENWVAYSCSCGCSLVRGIASRMCHGSWDGGRDDRSSLRLLSAASFVNELSLLLVSISLSFTPVMTVGGVTDGGSNQEGFLPHQKTGAEGKGDEIGRFCY